MPILEDVVNITCIDLIGVFRRNRVHSLCDGILRAREGFRLIARRAAVCYDCASHMKEVDPMYQLSFAQFLNYYDAAIAHSDR